MSHRFVSIAAAVTLAACTGDLEKQANQNEDRLTEEQTRAIDVEILLEKRIFDLESRLEALQNTVAELEDDTADNATDIATTNTALSGAQLDIMASSSKITTNTSDITDNSSAIAENASEMDGLAARATAAESAITANTANITDNTGRLYARHRELLFLWDGEAKYLGRFAFMKAGTGTSTNFVHYIPREANIFVGLTNNSFHHITFSNDDCTGDVHFHGNNPFWHMEDESEQGYPPIRPGLLDQGTGTVYRATDHISSNAPYQSKRPLAGGTCMAESSTASGVRYEVFGTHNDFVSGAFVSGMTWD